MEKMETKFYAICTTPRSGSNLLCDLLESSKVMGHPKEILNLDSVLRPFCTKHNILDADGTVYMNEYLSCAVDKFSSQNSVFGMKILFDQLEPLLESRALKDILRQCRFIWLVRKDMVAQAISMYIAQCTNEWTSLDKSSHVKKELQQSHNQVKVEYDEKKIQNLFNYLIKQNLKWLEFYSINQIEYMQVFYEDILANVDEKCHEICRFVDLEVDCEFLLSKTKFKKQGNSLNEQFLQMFRQGSSINLDRDNFMNHVELRGLKIGDIKN